MLTLWSKLSCQFYVFLRFWLSFFFFSDWGFSTKIWILDERMCLFQITIYFISQRQKTSLKTLNGLKSTSLNVPFEFVLIHHPSWLAVENLVWKPPLNGLKTNISWMFLIRGQPSDPMEIPRKRLPLQDLKPNMA